MAGFKGIFDHGQAGGLQTKKDKLLYGMVLSADVEANFLKQSKMLMVGYSISPVIRQFLLHWGYKLHEHDKL